MVYTGTHDNDTILGWYAVLEGEDKKLCDSYLNLAKCDKDTLHWDFIRAAMASVAYLAVIPMQDYLGLGSEARTNIPSTLGNNWKWRMRNGDFTKELAEQIKAMTKVYGRNND